MYLNVHPALTVWADIHFLRQVLWNLLSNAFKYTPPQTPIVLRAGQRADAQEGSSELSLAWICVQDAGPGIPPEEQDMLFQQFVRLKRDLSGTVRGTGLGLYLCRQFVETMNGRIWVESSGVRGEGSAFWLTLPVAVSAFSTSDERQSLLAD